MIPHRGSAYTHSYATMGRIWALGHRLGPGPGIRGRAATVAIAEPVPEQVDDEFRHPPPHSMMAGLWDAVPGIMNVPAVLIVVVLSLLLLMEGKTQESALVNRVTVALKLIVVLLFIALGWYINPANYEDYIPVNTGEFGHFGWSGVISRGIIFFAHIGFDAVSTAPHRKRKPQRDMPIGILGSSAICTVLYVLFGHVMTVSPTARSSPGPPDKLRSGGHRHRPHPYVGRGNS